MRSFHRKDNALTRAPEIQRQQPIATTRTGGLRIQTNTSALQTHRELTRGTSGLARGQERLTSEYRVRLASDDAAGLAIARSLASDLRSMNVSLSNVQEAETLVSSVSSTNSESIADILNRMRELAVMAAASNSLDQRHTLDQEFYALQQEINSTSGMTRAESQEVDMQLDLFPEPDNQLELPF